MASGINCPHCTQKINLPPASRQRSITCPMCKNVFDSPAVSINDRDSPLEHVPTPADKKSHESTSRTARSEKDLLNLNINELESESLTQKLGCGCLILFVIVLAATIVFLSRQLLKAGP